MLNKRINALCILLVVGSIAVLAGQFVAAHVLVAAHSEGLHLQAVK